MAGEQLPPISANATSAPVAAAAPSAVDPLHPLRGVRLTDILPLVMIALISSITPIAIRAAGKSIPPVLGGTVRFSFAGLALLAALHLRGRLRKIWGRDLLGIFALGILIVPINQFAIWQGTAWANASHSAIMYASTPVVVTLVSCFIGWEKFSSRVFIAALLAMFGVAVILLQTGLRLSPTFFKGDLLLLGAALSWALYLVGSKPLTRRYGSLNVQCWTFLTGAAVCVPFVLPGAVQLHWGAVTNASWMGLAYLSIMVSGVNYFLFNFSLARQPPSRVTIFSNAAYPLTVLWESLLQGEAPGLWFLGGAAMIFSGVFFTLFHRTPAAGQSHLHG